MKNRNKAGLLIILAGIGAGVAGGLIYYFEIGCNSGGCAITSNPWMSAFTGGLLGYLLTDSFLPFFRKKPGNSETGK